VGTLIWLTLNKGLSVGSWLKLMNIPPSYKVCNLGVEETPQHCLLECPMAQKAWNAFKRTSRDWKSNRDLEITWPFALIGEATAVLDDDTPRLLAYNPGGYTTLGNPSTYSGALFCTTCGLKDVENTLTIITPWKKSSGWHGWQRLRSVWPLGRLLDPTVPPIQSSIEITFRKEWLHLNIFGMDNATIRWHYLPPLYFLNFFND
jgi:hypothetical protein